MSAMLERTVIGCYLFMVTKINFNFTPHMKAQTEGMQTSNRF